MSEFNPAAESIIASNTQPPTQEVRSDLKFGDRVENELASADNPRRIGYFVRNGYRNGALNPGAFYEFTDGDGDFWTMSVGYRSHLTVLPALFSPPAGVVEEQKQEVSSSRDLSSTAASWSISSQFGQVKTRPECQCWKCQSDWAEALPFNEQMVAMSRMFLCETCGNKRCPHATHHVHACTGSNKPGQAGSNYA